VDVRTRDDRMTNKLFAPLVAITAAMFAYAPFAILSAPYESTMGLVQKIFYFHVPAAITMLVSAIVCGIASLRFLITRDKRSDFTALAAAELVLVFGVIVLATGPLWARKAWGVYWQWDVRLTSTLVGWMMAAAYMLLRRFGGPGSDRLAAGVALFGMVNVPFIYWSVNYWRTLHPKTTVVPSLVPSMRPAFYTSWIAFTLLYILLLTMRRRLQQQRALLDELYLAHDERMYR
jgi:heme exporter protein C